MSLLEAIQNAKKGTAAGNPPANPFAPAAPAPATAPAPASQPAKPEPAKPQATPTNPAVVAPAATAPAASKPQPAPANPATPAPATAKPADAGKSDAKADPKKDGASAPATAAATPAAATPAADAPAATAAPSEALPQVPIKPSNEVKVQQPKLDSANGVTLRFDNADIFEVVQTVMGDILHLNYVVDPGVTGKVNINGLSPVSAEDLLGVLQSVLAFNNVSIVREGNLYKVERDSLVPRDAVSGAATGNNGAMIQIFQPRYVQPSAVLNTLKNFIGPQAGITTDPTDHYLLVVDRAANMKKLQEILASLDVDYLSAVQTEIVQIENGDATEVAKEMETLFKTSQMYNWKGTEANKVFFMPIKRMNAILLTAATKDILETAKRRIKDVDIAPKEGLNARINIYTVKNNSADYLAGLISQIYGGGAPASSSSNKLSSASLGSASSTNNQAARVVEKGPVSSGTTATASGAGLSGEVQIIPNNKSNSLIIKAGRQDYLQILKLLDQLDTAPRQVLIQANIIEINLSKNNEMGVTWKLLNGNNVQFNGSKYATATTITPVGTTTNLAGGLAYGLYNGANFLSQLQAYASDGDIKVLSSPRVLASDGKEAKIEIGDDVSIKSGEVSSPTSANPSAVTSTYAYRTVGLLLHVKPSINESGLINLELQQEVSDLKKAGENGAGPTISKRSVDTEVTLQEGKTLIIGGLIKDKDNLNNNGVPYLKDVPVLGSLFRYQQKQSERTELVLTITPYIVRTPTDADRLAQDLDLALAELRKFMAPKPAKAVTTAQPAQPVARPN
ncbi:type II secretion system secretin GspD [Chitinimonas sp.]|uniref:type II secretion system secretin GspD n=1 Tax=Chitinimonas sp. TaxID=1934313 RepID=UPI0035AF9FA1